MSTPPISGFGLLKRVDDFDSFSEVRSVPAGSISEQVINAVRKLDEREEIEPYLRLILHDPMSRATVRSATPLMERKAWSSFCQSGSAAINAAMAVSKVRIWEATRAKTSRNEASTVASLTRRRWLRWAVCNSVSWRNRVTRALS